MIGNLNCLDRLECTENCPEWDEIESFVDYAETVHFAYRNDTHFRQRQMLLMIKFWQDYLTGDHLNTFNVYSGHDYTIEALISLFDYLSGQPVR